jgi:16S rRNA (cytosine1402-N4)-methyltransferase
MQAVEQRAGSGSSAEDPRAMHQSVLAEEILHALGTELPQPKSGWCVDATLGLGGHSERVLTSFPKLSVLGLDQDPAALKLAGVRLAPFGARVRLRHARASGLAQAVRAEGVAPVMAVLLDLGVSSMQLDQPERGFSFQADGPLDMRMDPTRTATAAQIVNGWSESELADLFYHEGGETRSRGIAKAIVEARRNAPFTRTLPLADLIARVAGRGPRGGKIHPATLCFQALRRAVNAEGEELRLALESACEVLAPGGLLAVISFHSGEDAFVKQRFAEGERAGEFERIGKGAIEPSREECRANPRARSAKLRIARRLELAPQAPVRQGGAA